MKPATDLTRLSIRELAQIVERVGLDAVLCELARRRQIDPRALDDSDAAGPG